jgi:hypothetical protein
MNEIRTPESNFRKIHLNIILAAIPTFSERSLPFGPSNQNLPQAHYIPRPPWFERPNNIWRLLQIMKFLILQFSPVSCHFTPLAKNTFNLCFLNVRDRVSQPYKKQKNIVLFILIRVAQSVKCVATGWTAGRSRFDPWQRISPLACVHTGSGAHPASSAMGTGVLSPGLKRGRDVKLTTHPI